MLYHQVVLYSDQTTIQEEVATLRDGLKPQVEELHRLEGIARCLHGSNQCPPRYIGKVEPKGFQLRGMTREDVAFLQQHS